MQKIEEKMEKPCKSQPFQFKKAKEKADFNLLDEEVPTQNMVFHHTQTHEVNEMTFKSVDNPPSNFEEFDDQFTEYVSGNENMSTEKNSEISFDELMKQPKLETHSSHQPHVAPPNHSQVIHSHPHNYVYTGHPQNLHPGYHSPYMNNGNMNQQNYAHNGYVGYVQHNQQPPLNLQYKKSEQPSSSAQQQPPPYQNFTLK